MARTIQLLRVVVVCILTGQLPVLFPNQTHAAETKRSEASNTTIVGAHFSIADSETQALVGQVASTLKAARTIKLKIAFRRQDIVGGKPWGREPNFGPSEVIQFQQPNIFSFGSSHFSDGKQMGINGEELITSPAPARIEDSNLCGAYPMLLYPGLIRALDFVDVARENAAILKKQGTKFFEGMRYDVLEADGPAKTIRWYIGSDRVVRLITVDARMWGGTGYHDEMKVTDVVIDGPIDADLCRPHPHKKEKTFGEAMSSFPALLPIGAGAPRFKVQRVGAPYDPTHPERAETEVDFSDVIQKHKATLLFFWTQRCGSCYFELPVLQELQEDWSPHGLAVCAIHIDMPPGPYNNNDLLNQLQVEKRWEQWGADALSDFIHNSSYTFRMLYDPSDKIKPLFFEPGSIANLGVSVLFDKDGRVVWRGIPYLECIEQVLRRLGCDQ